MLWGCAAEPETGALYRAPPVPNVVDGVVFEAGNWEPHLAAGLEGDSWGNHRAIVEVDATSGVDAVAVTIPWRRRDADPEQKSVVVVDAATATPLSDVIVVRLEAESGDLAFRPNPGSTTYHVYYMPWRSTGGYYPTVTYPDLPSGTDPTWAATVDDELARLPQGRVTHIQSVDAFHSFFPMEVIATAAEAAAFMAEAPRGWRIVPEYRDYPVRMQRNIPQHWAQRGSGPNFTSPVLRDERFTLQAVLVAGNEALEDVQVTFDGFSDALRATMTCFNCEGIDENGRRFEKDVDVAPGFVQPLWIGVHIPPDHPTGPSEGRILVRSANRGEQALGVRLDVQATRAVNEGYDEPDLMTRLFWLNSRAGADPDLLIQPFTPVEADGRTLSVLGREVQLGPSGLPASISSFFTPELTGLSPEGSPILSRPLALEVKVEGEDEVFEPSAFEVESSSRGRAEWRTTSRSERFDLNVEGALEYDGMLDYRLTLVARTTTAVDDVVLPVHYESDAAQYMLGLGRSGGRRPQAVDWRWAVENHQEGVWLGGVSKGLQYVLRDVNYVRPLNTNFYRNQPLEMPPSWFNEGRGGIRLRTEQAEVVAENYSGPRRVERGDTLHFNVRFLITPLKPIDTRTHFETRFVHQYVPVDSVVAWGGTVVNIHHANEINPYINYPFFALDAQSAYIQEAHRKGIKVKLYNTIRELTYRAHELFALRSLGYEILNDGEGGGHSWMQEHLDGDYHSAWHAWRVDDAALLDKGTSRWTNYYIEGLSWLAANQEIDGLYLDDIAFSRATVKRLVNVLQAERDEVVIDLHSANQFNERDGFTNSAMLYMEHFPYVSRLWFGEYFDYGQDEDYWMTEVAGLPFGLMGEMLQDGGHPYRGMLYGMTARKYGDVDPRPVWALMDEFGIAQSRMLGYWLEDAPVTTGHPRILGTAYVRPEGTLVALASWSGRDEVVSLTFDRAALGLGENVTASAPSVVGLQAAADVDLSAVQVPAGQGLFLLLESTRPQ